MNKNVLASKKTTSTPLQDHSADLNISEAYRGSSKSYPQKFYLEDINSLPLLPMETILKNQRAFFSSQDEQEDFKFLSPKTTISSIRFQERKHKLTLPNMKL
jgi:hypothetical protein